MPQSDTVIIQKSTEKVIIEGTIYYIHVVKRGETLYSISKAYGVELSDITKENPDVMYGLLIGQALKIPQVEIKKEEKKIDRTKFIYHKVKRGQTIYSLTRQYNIDTNILYKYNPEVRDGLKYNMVLRILKVKPGKKVKDDNYEYYKVKKKDTLYSLSKMFNVSIKAIKDANTDLKYGPLKFGQYIKIPRLTSFIGDTVINDQFYLDSSVLTYDSLIFHDADNFDCEMMALADWKDTLNVAVVMPFFLEKNRELNPMDSNLMHLIDSGYYVPANKDLNIYRSTYTTMEFYEGVLLAVDSLRKQGISTNLFIYSVEKDTIAINSIVREIKQNKVDLVIGPVYSKAIRHLTKKLKNEDIHVVLPTTNNNRVLAEAPNLFMIKPSRETEYYLLASLLSNYHDHNIVLINPDTFIDSIELSSFKQKLYSKITAKADINNVIIKEVLYNDTVNKALEHSLSEEKNNIVFINSTKNSFVSEIISKLNGLLLGYKIDMIGFPNWQKFTNLDVEYFYNLNFKFVTPFYVDYDSTEVRKFLKKYHKIFYTEPSRFSYCFHGYDIMFYFGNAIHKYGKSFPYCLSDLKLNLLHSEYRFYQFNDSSGYENFSGYIYHYTPDLNIYKYDLRSILKEEIESDTIQ